LQKKSYKQVLVKRHRTPTQTMHYLETPVPQIHLVAEMFLLLKSGPPPVIWLVKFNYLLPTITSKFCN